MIARLSSNAQVEEINSKVVNIRKVVPSPPTVVIEEVKESARAEVLNSTRRASTSINMLKPAVKQQIS